MKINYKQARSYSYGGKRSLESIKYIVIHYTGNNGDTAKNNADYFAKGNVREAGAHYFVDQKGEIWQTVKDDVTAWSVGGFFTQANGAGAYYKKCLNSNSVSIELCDCASKDPSADMIKSVKWLIEHIQKECPNAKTIIRHWDVNGKQCPAIMTGKDNQRWTAFLQKIKPTATKKTSSTLEVPTATLKKGSKGDQVKLLQRCLNKIMKSELAIDGSFGPATDKVVRAFQQRYNLTVDGSVGPKTRAKMKAVIV